jgi:[protein-PII] uridylyltransferase
LIVVHPVRVDARRAPRRPQGNLLEITASPARTEDLVMPTAPSPEFIRTFADSMPGGYRDKYDAGAIAAHARVAAARGERLAYAGVVAHGGHGEVGMCVVAQDRPGLLSTISAAFVLSKLDVTGAEAFTRRREDGSSEAVDLFWLRRTAATGSAEPITAADAEAMASLLVDLLEGRAPSAAPPEPEAPTSGFADTIVRFLDDKEGGLATLEVETDDRSGLLMALSRALFEQRVQIVRSEVRTVDRRVFDRFTVVEFDGSPITPARRLEIQVAVLNAVEPARRAQSVPPPL